MKNRHNEYTRRSEKHFSINLVIIGLIFLYALFALDRIKSSFSLKIEGHTTTNEIWIIPLLLFILFFSKKPNFEGFIFRQNVPFLIIMFIYIFIIAIGGFNIESFSQYIYASLIFLVPMFLFYAMSGFNQESIESLIKFFVIVGLIYSVIAIVLTTNYAYFMNILGNDVDKFMYYSQVRPRMMLGSSITVSYYLNLTLPINFYIFFRSTEKKWKTISLIAIITNIVATFVLLSRAATLCALIVIFIYLAFIMKKRNFIKSLVMGAFILITIIYVFKSYDLTRLLEGFSLSGSSVSERLTASKLGLYIFSIYPLFGSGIGRYFERIYSDRYINVEGLTGLIDPHNLYVLILSELGIIGLIVTIILFIYLFKRFSFIKEITLRQTGYLILFVFLFDAFGGSHLLNEISFATVFWIYIGLFNAASLRDQISLKLKV